MFTRLRKSRRGLGTIIGSVFLVTILLFGFSFIWWERQAYDKYALAVNDRDQREWELQSEQIQISTTSLTTSNKLNITVFNAGALTTHLVSLWLTEYNGTNPTQHLSFDLKSMNYYANPGSSILSIGSDLSFTATSSFNYYFKVTTERGNMATAYLSSAQITGLQQRISYSFGTMKIKYTVAGSGGYSSSSRPDADANGWCNPWITWTVMKTVPAKTNLFFKATFKNTWSQSLIISYGAILFQLGDPGAQTIVFIGGSLTAAITINPGETKELIWGFFQVANVFGGSQPVTLPWPMMGTSSISTTTSANPFLTGTMVLDTFLVVAG